jgi:hypothetical protein
MSDQKPEGIKGRIAASLSKSSRRLCQENRVHYTTCHRVAKKVKLHPCRESVVQKLLPVDKERRVHFVRGLWMSLHLQAKLCFVCSGCWTHKTHVCLFVYGRQKIHTEPTRNHWISRKLACAVSFTDPNYRLCFLWPCSEHRTLTRSSQCICTPVSWTGS